MLLARIKRMFGLFVFWPQPLRRPWRATAEAAPALVIYSFWRVKYIAGIRHILVRVLGSERIQLDQLLIAALGL